MKKMIALLLALVMAFALIACGIQKCKLHFLIRQQKA